MEDQFNIFLPSNALQSHELYPNNILEHYTTLLNEELYVDADEYEVGLTEIHYPHNFQNKYVKVEDDVEEAVRLQYYDWDDPKTIKASLELTSLYPGKKFATIQLLVDAINGEFKSIVTGNNKDFHVPDYEKEQRPSIKIDPKTNLYVTYNYLKLSERKFLRIVLGKKMAKRLGFLPLYFQKIVGERIYSRRASFICNYNKIFPQEYLFIYSDIGKPVFVGEKKVPLLRVVNIEGTPGDTVVSKFQNVQYVPLSRSHIRTIEIVIKNEFGEGIHFNEIGTVVVVLNFRRKDRRLN